MSTVAPFQTTRSDGRSDRQVVADLVIERGAGDIITHAEIADALAEGIDGEITRPRVYRAAAAASRWLTLNRQIALVPIRGVGYRVSVPDDFRALAEVRRDRASSQLVRGKELLDHAPYGRMSPDVRDALLPLQVLIGGAYAQLHAYGEHLARHDDAIRRLSERVDRIDGGEPPDVEGRVIGLAGEEAR